MSNDYIGVSFSRASFCLLHCSTFARLFFLRSDEIITTTATLYIRPPNTANYQHGLYHDYFNEQQLGLCTYTQVSSCRKLISFYISSEQLKGRPAISSPPTATKPGRLEPPHFGTLYHISRWRVLTSTLSSSPLRHLRSEFWGNDEHFSKHASASFGITDLACIESKVALLRITLLLLFDYTIRSISPHSDGAVVWFLNSFYSQNTGHEVIIQCFYSVANSFGLDMLDSRPRGSEGIHVILYQAALEGIDMTLFCASVLSVSI